MVVGNIGGAHHWLDHLYGAIMHRTRFAPQFFSGGWGADKLELLEQMSRELIAEGFAQVALQHWPPPAIDPIWRTLWETRRARLQEGIFATPCEEMLKQVLPLESQTARVRLLSPRNVPSHEASCVVHLAGTGDHGFDRRMRLGAPLLKKNIATMVLERRRACSYGGFIA
ncbi:hypothetical protein M758_4G254400 [Ceratodon purpureus]|nr:hypothetical protein M758_4G254400 [Ceratodon purpureus]